MISRTLLAGLAAMAFSTPAAAQTLLVGNKGENSLSLIDLGNGRELRRLETGPAPHEIAISPDGRTAAIVHYGGSGIDLFDVASATLIERIDIAPNQRPHGLVWLPDGRLVATAEGSDSLAIVRVAHTGDGPRVRQVPTGQQGSHMVAVSRDGARAYVVNMRSASVSVIDLARGAKLRDIRVGREPEGIALSPKGDRLWIADRGGARLHVFDTATMREVGSVGVGAVPIRVAISPDGRHAVTSNFGDGTLTVVDTQTLQPARTIRVSGDKAFEQVTILFDANGERLYVAETGIDRIAEVDFASGRVLGRLPAGRQGDGLAISPVSVRR
ncbi:cytochrome D1 domain-containing protein [Sphingomonas baiyangensis]|uniref:YncE family protein n=1 Tax=Sphingomonas baiyangensis TaxID=2572576 RepID=A0A4U1L129_9SPHN|nr:cytochrome D1 domain-containing protein [Sphingomonas baiyangensis]TKD50479.1 YncE family protein [Sphingomonas baiyangensis]